MENSMASNSPENNPGAVSLADEGAVKEILVSIVNNLTRLKPSKKERYRVSIFGSARAKPETTQFRPERSNRRSIGQRPTAGSARLAGWKSLLDQCASQ
jgi:hypothetical protein